MRVLLITATYPPSLNGVAVNVSNLKKTIKELGHDVRVLAPNHNEKNKDPEIYYYPSLPNPLVKDYPIPLFPGVRSIYKLITSFKPDIVHVHHPFHVGYFAKIIADRFSVPLVFTYHTRYDLYAEEYVDFLPKSLKRKFIENTVDKFYKTADLVIAPSNYVKNILLSKNPYINIETLPSGIMNNKIITTDKKTLRKNLRLPLNKKILLSLSRLGKEKGIDLLIRSMNFLNEDYLLVIAGKGPDEKRLKKLVFKLKLKNRIKFVGGIEHSKVDLYYRSADLFYCASQTETQGLIFLESLSNGLPIVAVKSPAADEWITESTGILTPPSPKALSKGVTSLNEGKVRSMSVEAEKITREFSQKNQSQKLITYYENIIERKKLAVSLLKTGWQSWSPQIKRPIKIPQWNYKPNSDFYLPETDVKIIKKPPVKGWCSWYAYGKNISEKKILENADFIIDKKLPIDHILIDDGWTKVGDWNSYDNEKFPKGIKNTISVLHKRGLKAGLWMSPFLVEESSKLYREHPEMLVKTNGLLMDGLKAFPMTDTFYPRYVLDVRKNDCIPYIKKQLDLLLGVYGIDLIKLDFLYSIFFIQGITEKEAGFYINDIFKYIKTNYPEVYTIACGAPLAPLLGVADSVRIGPDIIDPVWSKRSFMNLIINRYRLHRVSNNLKVRKWTEIFWNLDPDVFVCSPKLGLTEKEINKLSDNIITAKGNLFLGDNLTELEDNIFKKYINKILNK